MKINRGAINMDVINYSLIDAASGEVYVIKVSKKEAAMLDLGMDGVATYTVSELL